MPSYFEELKTEDGTVVRAFHDSLDCVNGGEHDWSGWRDHYDYCEHDGEHTDECRPSGGEAFCLKCDMGAMHYSLMSGD